MKKIRNFLKASIMTLIIAVPMYSLFGLIFHLPNILTCAIAVGLGAGIVNGTITAWRLK